MLLAQLSDPHILPPGRLFKERVDTAAMLRAAVAFANAHRPTPDALLLTGDLTESGDAEAYAHLADILAAARMPVYLLPGNHDAREALRDAFPGHDHLPPEGFLHYAVTLGPLRLVVLDTLIPGAGDGELCAERLAWLEARLVESPTVPTVLAMHHPPIPMGMNMDRHRLREPAALAALLGRHPQVRRILCGHVHRHVEGMLGGVPVSACPGTAHQVALDPEIDAPLHFSLEPPGMLLHAWLEGQGLITHHLPIGQWEGPYPFRAPKPAGG